TGNQLWSFQTGMPVGAPPMAWSDGKDEYISLAVGGNRGGITTLDGDEVWTFSLNGAVDQMESPPPVQTSIDLTANPIKLGAPIASPQTAVYGGKPFDGTMYTYEYGYTPQVVQVPTGTTLTWQNDGSVIHTATATDGSWDTGDINPGQTAQVVFGVA